MQRKRNGLLPAAEVLSGLGGPVKAIREASPQARHHFTQADQVNHMSIGTGCAMIAAMPEMAGFEVSINGRF